VVVERYYTPVGNLYYREHAKRESSWINVSLNYAVRHIERWFGVPYTVQVKRLMTLLETIGGQLVLVADATGVGRGVVDMLKVALDETVSRDNPRWQKTWYVTPGYVQITSGATLTRSPLGILNCPKRDLIAAPLILFQDQRLLIGEDLEYQDVLQQELLRLKVKINISTAHDAYEAWRENEHDDLVLALSLACWAAETFMYEEKRIEVPGIVVPDAPVHEFSGGSLDN
jgi:hypothetical protein